MVKRFKLTMTAKQSVAVRQRLQKGQLVVGPDVDLLEKKLSSLFQKKYVLCTHSGFSALHLSLEAWGRKDRPVLTPVSSTCFAMVNAIKASGNHPYYIDLDPQTGNMDLQKCVKAIQNIGVSMAVDPNHFGLSTSFRPFSKQILIIEDCAQSFFTSMESDSSAKLQVLSFYPTKGLNAVDGGAILTNDKKLYQRLVDRVYYGHQSQDDDVVRFNYRMPNIHAALGLASLLSVKNDRKILTKIAKDYSEVVSRFNFVKQLGEEKRTVGTVPYKYVLKFESERLCLFFQKRMNKFDIPCVSEFIPLVKKSEFRASKYPGAIELLKTTCSVPLYPALTSKETGMIMSRLESTLRKM